MLLKARSHLPFTGNRLGPDRIQEQMLLDSWYEYFSLKNNSWNVPFIRNIIQCKVIYGKKWCQTIESIGCRIECNQRSSKNNSNRVRLRPIFDSIWPLTNSMFNRFEDIWASISVKFIKNLYKKLLAKMKELVRTGGCTQESRDDPLCNFIRSGRKRWECILMLIAYLSKLLWSGVQLLQICYGRKGNQLKKEYTTKVIT